MKKINILTVQWQMFIVVNNRAGGVFAIQSQASLDIIVYTVCGYVLFICFL